MAAGAVILFCAIFTPKISGNLRPLRASTVVPFILKMSLKQMKTYMHRMAAITLVLAAGAFGRAVAQPTIDVSMTPLELVQNVLLGNGVAVFNVTFNGQPANQFNNQIGHYIGPSNFVGFNSGVALASALVQSLDPNYSFGFEPLTNPVTNDPDLMLLSGFNINDAAVLEFDFIPNGDSLQFRYVWGSREYPNYTCTQFNDVFGFFLSGPGINGPFSNNAINIAVIPGTNTPVGVNTINGGAPTGSGQAQNCFNANPNWIQHSAMYFVNNNPQDPNDIQMPGLTVPLTAVAEVICGQTYHIKIAIGDAVDGALDSMVILESESFSSNSVVQVDLNIPVGINDSTLYEGCGQAILKFIRPPVSLGLQVQEVAYLAFSGTAINGLDILPALPDSVVFLPGIDTVMFILTAPPGAAAGVVKTFTVTITNIASNCSAAELTSEFTFYISYADPLEVTSFNAALADCNDQVVLFPTVTGGYGEYRYLWSTGATSSEITVSPGFTTTYFLTVSDTCGAGFQQVAFQVSVPVYPPVVVDLGPDITVNECDVTVTINPTVSGGFGNYAYSWTRAGELLGNLPVLNYLVTTSTNLTLTVTDDCGATGVDVVAIIVPPVEVTVVLPDIFEVTSCLEGFLMPAISEGGIGTKTYTWWVDGQQQAQTQNVWFEYHAGMGQMVVIRAEDECQNFATDTTVVRFNFPAIFIETSPDTAICRGTEALLRVSATGGSGGNRFLWEELGSAEQQVVVTPAGFERYFVTVTDTCGVKAEGVIRVNIRAVDAAFDFDYVDYYGVRTRNQSSPLLGSQFTWDFGDGTTSTQVSPRHTFRDIEEYTIALYMTDEAGCPDSAFKRVIPPLEIFIPNSFTPNGDGFNDLFQIVGANVTKFEMWIYDRWGREVFYTNDINKKWNGSHNGGDYYPTTSSYAYLIKYQGVREEDTIERTGTVTVIR